MKTEYHYLLHLLGAYLRQEAPETREDLDWEALIQLAQIHGVVGILGYMGKKYPICPDARWAPQLRGLCLNTISVFARRNALAEAMARTLEEAGIDHILMKGFVLRDYFPVPELRTFTDIDLVIRPEDRQKSHELMLSLGFQVKTDWEPVYSYYRGNEFYELHTEIMEVDVSEKADYRGYFRDLWSHAQKVSDYSWRFAPEFHFLYMLTHIAKHIHGSGAGARMYLDVAAFVRHFGDQLDWNWIAGELDALKLRQFAGVVLAAVEKWFGVSCSMPGQVMPEAVLEAFTEFTMEAGTFGHQNRDQAVSTMKGEDLLKAGSRTKLVLRKTFPDAKTLQSRYTYLQDKPWLLPAAWVHRLIRNREKLGKHTKQMQEILEADSEEVLRLKTLMGQIGL